MISTGASIFSETQIYFVKPDVKLNQHYNRFYMQFYLIYGINGSNAMSSILARGKLPSWRIYGFYNLAMYFKTSESAKSEENTVCCY